MDERSVTSLCAQLDVLADTEQFSGVVLVRVRDRPILERASGWADRARRIPMSLTTRLATASGTKGFTALTVASMIEDGLIELGTTVREVVGDDLPHVDPAVTVEHLLTHTSGVGDYLDEAELGDVDEIVLDVPADRLCGPEDYLPLLAPLPQVFPPGDRFTYNNGGFVILALVVERVAGGSYHDEVRRRVFARAGMADSDFLRSDRLPAGTALGYLRDGRTNVGHLPVIGTGDGGAYSTGPDLLRFWSALFEGRIVGAETVARLTSLVSAGPWGRYGSGFWIGPDGTTVQLEGMDAGVSLRTGANPETGFVYCLVANDSTGVWPLATLIDRYLEG